MSDFSSFQIQMLAASGLYSQCEIQERLSVIVRIGYNCPWNGLFSVWFIVMQKQVHCWWRDQRLCSSNNSLRVSHTEKHLSSASRGSRVRTADKTNGKEPFPVEGKNRKSSATNTHFLFLTKLKFIVSQSSAKWSTSECCVAILYGRDCF